jgi:Zn-dependent peptidase ImmA (M78 family)/transcriptional regulator with XRE-family HTH domain
MIGARLKLARSAAGLSLRALEDRLEGLVTAQAIGKYERDEMMPSSAVLIALAKVLGVTEEHLLNTADIELVGVEFRKQKLTTTKDDATVRARILSEVERYLEIERILHLDSSEANLPPKRVVRSMDDVESAACKLRDFWRLGHDAIPNLCEFLEEKGIKICAVDLPAKVSGVQAMVRTADDAPLPVIVVNASHAGERQRFTIAHELGHLYLSPAGGFEVEAACQRFAGAFLVPKDVLLREVGGQRRSISVHELLSLKVLFGVSAQAIAYRCKDLGIISQTTFSGIFRLFSAKGWRVNEPLSFSSERPIRFERLCLRALAEGLISESKASELLQKTIRGVDDFMNTPPEGFDGSGPRL